MGLLPVGEGGAVDGGVGTDWGDHERPEDLALVVEEVLGVAGGDLVGSGGGDGGGGGGGGEVGVVAGEPLSADSRHGTEELDQGSEPFEKRRKMMKVAVTVTAQITMLTMAAMTTVRVEGLAVVLWGAAKVVPASCMRTAMLPR